MKPFLIDTHTHIQFSQYDLDREETIKRAIDANIWMINSGSNSLNSEAAVELAEKYNEGVYATVGIHPSHTDKSAGSLNEESGYDNFDYEKLRELALNKKTLAIGECGLDYYRGGESYKNDQAEAFLKQIELAHEVRKPLVIHCREAYQDAYEILTSKREELLSEAGIMHFFSGTKEEAKKFLDLGFSFTFGGAITYPKSKSGGADYEELIKYLPFDRIMVETDAPYVSPVPYRGGRNEPLYVQKVAEKMGEMIGRSLEEAASQTTSNAGRIFAINAKRD